MKAPVVTVAPEIAALLPPALFLAKATVLMSFAALSAFLLRRSSASARHFAWALGVAGVLALPVVSSLVPSWRVTLPVTVEVAPREAAPRAPRARPATTIEATDPKIARVRTATFAVPPVDSTPAPRSAGVSWLAWIVLGVAATWIVGALASLARLVASTWKAAALVRRSRVVPSDEILDEAIASVGLSRGVRLAESAEVLVPMTFGALRPVVLVPDGFAEWAQGRRRAVLLHELAHVRRNDWLVLCLAQVASVLYWFHPLVRAAESALRREAEQAADDLVLASGTRPSTYAAHLVGLVRALHDGPGAHAMPNGMTVSMIGGPFDGRIRAILDAARSRGPVGRGAGALACAAALGAVLVCSSVDVSAQTARDPKPAGRSDQAEREAKEAEAAARSWSRTFEAHGREIHRAIAEALHDALGIGRDDDDWYGRAMDLHQDGRYAEAIPLFQKSIEANERVAAATYNVACGHARLGHVDEAFAWLGKAEDAGFDVGDYLLADADLASLRGDARYAALTARLVEPERLAEPREQLAKLRESSSHDAEAWADAAKELHSSGQNALAAEAYQRARELEPGDKVVLYNLACDLALAGNRSGALDALQAAVDSGWTSRGHMDEDSDLDSIRNDPRYEEIARAAETLEMPGSVSFLGLEFGSGESWGDAAARYESYLKDHPKSGLAWFNLGFASLKVDDPARAATAFQKAHELRYRMATSAYNVACSYARKGEPDRAFEWLDRCVAEGFDVSSYADHDDDLASLRADSRFGRYRELERQEPSKHGVWVF